VTTDLESIPAGFCACSWNGVKDCWETGTGVPIIFGSNRSLHGLYKRHCFSTKYIAEFQLHWWLPETDKESDSQIYKISNPGPASKTLEQEQSLKMWFRPPQLPSWLLSLVCSWCDSAVLLASTNNCQPCRDKSNWTARGRCEADMCSLCKWSICLSGQFAKKCNKCTHLFTMFLWTV